MENESVLDVGAIVDEVDKEVRLTGSSLRREWAPKTEDDLMTDLLEDIDQQDVEELGLDSVQEKGISNENQAEWFIGHYKMLAEQQEKINKTADEQIAAYTKKVNAWREKRLDETAFPMNYAMEQLKIYLNKQLQPGAKKKSIKFIEGTIGLYKQQPSYERNDDKIRKFLEDTNASFLEDQPKKVLWSDLKKSSKLIDGIMYYNDQAVPGVVVTQKPDKFTVK